MFKKNLEKLKQDLTKNNIDLAVITDDDSINYLQAIMISYICLLVDQPFY